MPPPASRRSAQRTRAGRATATLPRASTGRQQARGRTSTALRGTGRKVKETADNPTLGIISAACFVLFWVFLALAVNGVITSASNHDVEHLKASAGLALFSFLFPFAGLATGIAGLVNRRSQRVMAWIGTLLNAALLVFVLVAPLLSKASTH